MKAGFYNRLWLYYQFAEYKRFRDNLDNLKQIQALKFQSYIIQNKDTRFGLDHKFKEIRKYSDYKRNVPIIEDYDQILPYIDSIDAGKENILFTDQTEFLESTSGSTSASKIIPYNKALKAEIQSAVAPWMWSLFKYNQAIFSGKSYWSISPPLKNIDQKGGKKVILSDTDFFDPIAAQLLSKIMAVPSSLGNINRATTFYQQTWKYLLQEETLSFISCWSPSFILKLFDFLQEHFEYIIKISQISIARRKYLEAHYHGQTLDLPKIFPNLQLISCWQDGQSAIWQPQLREISGQIFIQGKGVIMTEGVLTVPYTAEDPVLAYCSHFFEFRDPSGELYLAHQLQKGTQYEVIITTGGGLYRYNTHDLMECCGYTKSVPTFRFLGRTNQTCDLAGEKLSEWQVNKICTEIIKTNTSINFLALYPVIGVHSAYYTLLYESKEEISEVHLKEYFSSRLNENPYYVQSINTGQLTSLQIRQLQPGRHKEIIQHFLNVSQIREGDFKMPLLFQPGFLKSVVGF
ncbi:MAG TPA: GH3 auxin-responsive promoter family protein [Saprospiraceae bacterium]|nr:GH3 auxin-responsive promoter family protein [Saprospiraceae bacterium]